MEEFGLENRCQCKKICMNVLIFYAHLMLWSPFDD